MTKRSVPPLEGQVPRYQHKKRRKPYGLKVIFKFPWHKSLSWNQWYRREHDRDQAIASLQSRGYKFELMEKP